MRMKKTQIALTSGFTLLVLLFACVTTLWAAETPLRLAIIGDSTVCEYPPERDCRGWGQYIQDYFKDTVRVINLARSGRSTKTFINEGLWARTLEEKPDVLLIQFGHNDSHGPDRPESTDAATDFRDYLRRYVDQSRAIGAMPILVTPVQRRTYNSNGKLDNSLIVYADAMKAVAAEKKVGVIDLNASSGRLYEQLGPAANDVVANAPGDRTHFNENGARMMAHLVMQELTQVEPRLVKELAPEGLAALGGIAEKPLFRDPVYDGAADPVLCWNRAEKKWFMFYTNRRANEPNTPGVTWVHGTHIGIAESSDGGATWKYRGTANIDYGRGEHSYWAPEVIEHDGTYHMYLTFVPGIFRDWAHPRDIIHLTSRNLVDWKYESTLKLSSNRVIDACVMRLPDSTWRMWYNNEVDRKSIYCADSSDLFTWKDRGKVIGDQPGEGPKVFRWKDRYWMVVDVWDGLGVYGSDDCENWTRQKKNLLSEPGQSPTDRDKGRHPDVVVSAGRAFLFYFTHQRGQDAQPDDPYAERRSVIHVVELEYEDGELTCDRNKPTRVFLQPADNRSSQLAWPKVTRECKPWTRWWWMGSIVNEQDLTTEMEKYAAAGLGGLEITPIYGVKGYEDRFINYLSPAWMKMLVHTLKEGERLDMGIDMATGNGWPFGGQWIGADDACRNVAHKTFTLKSGERLSEAVTFVQKPMVRAIGRRLNISELVEPISDNENLQVLALEQVRFEKPLPLQVLMAYCDRGGILDLTDKVGEDGKLDWVAPAGDWTLYAVFQGWHGKMVERSGPGGEGNVIDHFSDKALGNYLKKFDEAYVGHDVRSLRAYFNDSYEVDDASGESNWTGDFFEEFEKRRGYDLRRELPALFGKDSADRNIRVLCDYRETISDLLLDEFTIPWRRWAQGKGALTRNQAHGSPANILDLYAASGIPETEGSNRLGFKMASSAAHVTGKLLASSESATWLDEHFCANLGDVKVALDRFFLGGINHICYHGTTFSPPGEEWPGWMFYASVHFGPTNSFWNDFSALNEYVTRCQSFLQSGRPDNDVLLYFPIYDEWSRAGRSMLQHFSASAPGNAGTDGQALLERGYTFDFISDRQLEDVDFAGNSLRTGGASYKIVVLPQCRFVPVKTFEKLIELARKGATIVVHNSLPSDVPGWGSLDERRKDFNRLVARIDFAKASADIQIAKVGSGKLLLGDDLGRLLSGAQVKRESMVDQGLQFVRCKHGDGRCYLVVNKGDDLLDGWVPLQADEKSIAIYDPMHGRNGVAAVRASDTGVNEVYLQLAPGESCILKTFETVVNGPLYRYLKATGQAQEINGTWTVSFVEGGPELPRTVRMESLGSWTDYEGESFKPFSGTAEYAISFTTPAGQAAGWLLDLGRVCQSAGVKLNGKKLGTLISPPFRVMIPRGQMKKENILEIKVSNLMANRIADLDRRNVNWKKFYNVNFPAKTSQNRGPDGLFTASRWPPRESGLIGPVTLTPIDLVTPSR